MKLKYLAVITVAFLFSSFAKAQVPPPTHESGAEHLKQSRGLNYSQRFEAIKCALVLIESGPRLGTGFYVSADGDVATASHVLGDRAFSKNPQGTIQVTFTIPRSFSITNSKGEHLLIGSDKVENNADAWVSDVAKIKTGSRTSCWLREGDDKKSLPGEHLISMGFPGLSFKALTIYTGIMSARLTTNLPTIILTTGEAVPSPNEFIRVQMPISTGLSGAPIIDDENRAIAIVTQAGGWTQDLDNLLIAFKGGAFATPPVAPDPKQAPNTVTFNINQFAATAELAGLFHDYASPGYGDAVPLRYLRKAPQPSQPSSSHDH